MTEPDAFREFVIRRSPALLGSAWLLTGTGLLPRMQTALLTNWTRWSQVVRRDTRGIGTPRDRVDPLDLASSTSSALIDMWEYFGEDDIIRLDDDYGRTQTAPRHS